MILCSVLCCSSSITANAKQKNLWPHEPRQMLPFGSANPKQTDAESRIFDQFIGAHKCTQLRLNDTTDKMVSGIGSWVWYHNMNGHGIRDEYRFNHGAPVSQRVYDPVKKEWHVWYFISQGFYYAGEWVGGRKGELLVFEQENSEGKVQSRLEFFNITSNSYEWKSTNVDVASGDESVDWEISCERVY